MKGEFQNDIENNKKCKVKKQLQKEKNIMQKNMFTKNEFINDIYIRRIFSNPINKDYITKSFSFFLKYTKIIDNMLKIQYNFLVWKIYLVLQKMI